LPFLAPSGAARLRAAGGVNFSLTPFESLSFRFFLAAPKSLRVPVLEITLRRYSFPNFLFLLASTIQFRTAGHSLPQDPRYATLRPFGVPQS
jgi:hypothetical protein